MWILFRIGSNGILLQSQKMNLHTTQKNREFVEKDKAYQHFKLDCVGHSLTSVSSMRLCRQKRHTRGGWSWYTHLSLWFCHER
jgi:hypothetical protein